ncbi:hypothetical protein ACLQ18_39430 [Streptomyces sp. DT193]|uniref:hypothetical protein n=1 Tax=Streptomyces sp. DT193 TaxID=3393418 RepID=UPI003CF7240F
MTSQPFHGDGRTLPYRADGIAGRTAETVFDTLRAINTQLLHGQDVDKKLDQNEELSRVLDLQNLYEDDQRPPGAGVVGQSRFWDELQESVMPRIVRDVDEALRNVANDSGLPVTVIGETGDVDARTDMVRKHIQSSQPVVSISPTGDWRKFFTTGDARSASLSILVWLPRWPLHAAVVTAESVLMSDCSNAYRMSPAGQWTQMLGEPLVPEPEPGYIVVPQSMRHMEARLRDEYEHPIFVEDTASAITEAVLNRAVPAAVHLSEGALNSALLLVSAGHGMSVRLYSSSGTLKKPWDASRTLYNAIMRTTPFVENLVIARDEVTARRVGRIVEEETDRFEQLGFPGEDTDDDFDF